MKKRITKKYINRYVMPIVDNLPGTSQYAQEEDETIDGLLHRIVYDKQHCIVNGWVIGQGERHKARHDLLRNIRETCDKACEIIESHKRVYFRSFQIRGNRVCMRLITE